MPPLKIIWILNLPFFQWKSQSSMLYQNKLLITTVFACACMWRSIVCIKAPAGFFSFCAHYMKHNTNFCFYWSRKCTSQHPSTALCSMQQQVFHCMAQTIGDNRHNNVSEGLFILFHCFKTPLWAFKDQTIPVCQCAGNTDISHEKKQMCSLRLFCLQMPLTLLIWDVRLAWMVLSTADWNSFKPRV